MRCYALTEQLISWYRKLQSHYHISSVGQCSMESSESDTLSIISVVFSKFNMLSVGRLALSQGSFLKNGGGGGGGGWRAW